MTRAEAAARITSKVQAYCESCGHSWEIEPGGALDCLFCPNRPEEIAFRGSLLVLEEDGSPIFGRGKWRRRSG